MFKDLEAFFEQHVTADTFSGTALVAKEGDILFQGAYGIAEKDFDVPVQMNTRLNLGSMNKMFTGVAIAQLAERGKVAFDAPISAYLPEYPREEAKHITLYHLLTHTSGLGSYWNDAYTERRMRLRRIKDFLELFVDDPLLFAPGEKWFYSNAGYIVLGAIVERASEQDYFSYVREHVFHPAGMYDTDSYELDQIVSRRAVGYTYAAQSEVSEARKRKNNLILQGARGSSAGGGYSTAHDLFKFGKALRSHVFLSPAMREVLLTGKVDMVDVPGLLYAYGFTERRVNGKRWVGHTGDFPGVSANFAFSPESGDTVVVLANYDAPIANQVAETLWTWLDRRGSSA